MRDYISKHKAATGIAAVLGVAVVAYLAFGVFGVHTLFVDKTVDEAGPVFDSGTAAGTTQPAASNSTAQAAATTSPVATEAPTQTAAPDDAAPATTPATNPATTAAAGGVVTIAQGDFAGADASHDVAGQAIVLGDGSEQRFLRFENFEATNGPDLKVYLRASGDDYVSLGELKGNIGSQNYEIPPEVDLATYSTVDIWCERFSVSFGHADLA